MTKNDFAEKIKRRLGAPMIKVELDESQIFDSIDYARSKYIKWAVGNATHEVFFTMALSAGQNLYDMPVGVTEIISYDGQGVEDGINTLFTVDNYLYNQGFLDAIVGATRGYYGYNLISYHIALDFLSTVKKYTPDRYNWKYHRYTNQLEVHPAPPSGNSLSVIDEDTGETITIDSPGYVLLKGYMIEGSTVEDDWQDGDSDKYFYESTWMLDYAEALCKITLGRIRSKFAAFNSIGNIGITLDGDTLLAEGKEEKERLETSLKDEETYDGWPIMVGF